MAVLNGMCSFLLRSPVLWGGNPPMYMFLEGTLEKALALGVVRAAFSRVLAEFTGFDGTTLFVISQSSVILQLYGISLSIMILNHPQGNTSDSWRNAHHFETWEEVEIVTITTHKYEVLVTMILLGK